MNISFAVGNPPYSESETHKQLYPDIYLAAQQIAECVDLIFPTGWQEPKSKHSLSKMNCSKVKEDPQIVLIDNREGLFPNVPGANKVNIIIWKKGYDNGFNGLQKVLTNGSNAQIIKLAYNKSDAVKPAEIRTLQKIVREHADFNSISDIVSKTIPYGLPSDFLLYPQKYQLPDVYDHSTSDDDLCIYGLLNRRHVKRYAPKTYPLPRRKEKIKDYKVFIPEAWGNMSNSYLIGGTFSDIIIGSPYTICTATFLVIDGFQSREVATYCAKYLMTTFCRALLFANKTSQHSTTAWEAIPIQDFSESWWSESIAEIDKQLYKKYDVPQNIIDFVMANTQIRTEENIQNFNSKEMV